MINDLQNLEIGDLVILYASNALEPDEIPYVEAELQKNPEFLAKAEELRKCNAELVEALGSPFTYSENTESVESSETSEPVNVDKRPEIASQNESRRRLQIYKILGNVGVLVGGILIGLLLFPVLTNTNKQPQNSVGQNQPPFSVDETPTGYSLPDSSATNTQKKEFLRRYDEIVKNFSSRSENQEKIKSETAKIFQWLNEKGTLRAEDCKKIADDLKNLGLDGDDDNFRKLLQFVDEVKVFLEKNESSQTKE